MSLNASSSNDSHPHPDISVSLRFHEYCILTKPSSFIFIAYCITNTLVLLPLCIFVLHLGFRRWRRQCSTSTGATMSHSESFTYHVVAMELIGVLGSIICCFGIGEDRFNTFFAGMYLWSLAYYGEMFFHILTCVERYLAVVHPIIYRSLRSERGIRMRNTSIGCVWLLCFGVTAFLFVEPVALISDFCLLTFAFIITSFCSLSVLYVLIRPGPGKQGTDKERVDQSKQRAFYTIMAILGALLLRIFWSLIWAFLYLLTGNQECLTMTVGIWFYLPSSLVLPLLFLHREGMLACCKNNNK